MSTRKFRVPVLLLLAAAGLSLGVHQGICAAAEGGNGKAEDAAQAGQGITRDQVLKKFNKVSPAEQKAAAKRAAEAGLVPGVAGMAPGGSEDRSRDLERGN